MPNSTTIGYFSDSPFYFNEFLQFSSFEHIFSFQKDLKGGKKDIFNFETMFFGVTTHLMGVAIQQLGEAS